MSDKIGRFTTEDGSAVASDDGEFVLFEEYQKLAYRLDHLRGVKNDLEARLISAEGRLGALTWRRVSDGYPTELGRLYAVHGTGIGYVTEYDGTNLWHADAVWLGPLPDAPNKRVVEKQENKS